MPTAATYRVPEGLVKRRRFAPSGRKGGGKGAGADFRTPVEQPNTARSTAVAHVLDILCEGPIGGLYDGLKSVFYDDTPVQNADGSLNFDGVSISLRPGTSNQSVMPGFFRTEAEVVVGIEATILEGPVTQRVDDTNVDLVRVKVRLHEGLLEVITDEGAPNYGDVVATTVQFRIQVSVDSDSFVDIEGSPFTVNEKTAANYELQYEFELPDGEDTWDIRLVRVTEDSTESRLRNGIMFGTLTEITTGRVAYADTAVLGQIVNAGQFGSRVPARAVEVIGTEVSIPSNYDPVEHTYDPDIWDGRFATAATENPVWHLRNMLLNERYGCGQDIPEEYTDKFALYEIARYCDGRVPSAAGRRPQFLDALGGSPFNLYVAMGNHGFEVGDWIYIAGAENEEYNGLFQIDVVDQNFFTILAAVDEAHFDNNPNLLVYSTEPRFTINTVFNTPQSAYDLISAICSCFRAMPYWTTGGVALSQDAPAVDLGRVVGRSNVIDSEFIYSGPALKDRASVVKVTWIDPQDAYKPAVEYVEDQDLIERFERREIEVYAVGATTRSQARRHGLWMLQTQKYCSQVVTYRAGLDHATYRPGEIVRINDPAQAGIRNSGRVAGFDSATGAATVTLDSGVDFAEGHTYTLAVMMSDGTVEDREVTNAAGEGQTVITVDPAFSATEMILDAVWGISGTDVALRPFRVVAVREVRQDQYEITAVAHEPDIYDAIDFGAGVAPVDFDDIPTGPLAAPSRLNVMEYQYTDGLTIQPRALFSWQRADDARVTMYELQIIRPGQFAWESYDRAGGITTAISGVVQDSVEGSYMVRVRGRDNLGRTSPWFPSAEGQEFILLGLNAVPSDVENFRTSISIQRMKLLWDPVPDLILDHYEIRFSPALVGATWAGALPVGQPIPKGQLEYDDVVVSGTYFIKAISVRDIESLNAATIIVDVIGNINLNQVIVVEEHPDFAGERVDVEVVDDQLELAGDEGAYLSEWGSLAEVITLATGVGEFSPSGTYYGADHVDLGSVFDVRVTPEIHADGYNIYNVIESWLSLAEVQNLAGFVEGEVGVEFLVDITLDDPADIDAVWDGYKPLIGADVRARGIRWLLRLTTTKPWVTPRVQFFAVTIDMYDRIIDGKDQQTVGGELVVDFVPPFRGARPSAVITIQNGEMGDYMNVRNSTDTADGPDADGMIVRVFDENGDPVERTIDYHIKGYGAVIT